MRLEMEFPEKKERRSFRKLNIWSPIKTFACPFQLAKKAFKKETMGCCNRWNKFRDCRYSDSVDTCPLREYISEKKFEFDDDDVDDKN